MTTQTAAGAKLGISAALPATYDATGFAALTFTNIGEVTNLGTFGRKYNVVSYNPLASRSTQKRKGSFNSGTLSPQLSIDDADAGQIIMRSALASDAEFSFQMTKQDGKKVWCKGIVTSFEENLATVDTIYNATATIEINTDSTGVDFVRSTT